MKKIAIARTILVIAPQIDDMCQAIQKANYMRAINSFYGLHDTEAIMNLIIDKGFKGQSLHNLNVKVLRQLEAMPEKLATVLKLLFWGKIRQPRIAVHMGISERSVYRLQKRAIQYFADNLDKISLSEFAFRQLMAQHNWIRLEYEKQLTGV